MDDVEDDVDVEDEDVVGDDVEEGGGADDVGDDLIVSRLSGCGSTRNRPPSLCLQPTSISPLPGNKW